MTDLAVLATPHMSVSDWERLVREHGPRIRRHAYRLTGDVHDADDLTQETFARALRSCPEREPEHVSAWLHRIATNLFLDQARRRARIRVEAMPGDPDRLPAPVPDAAQAYEDAMLDLDVRRALADLPEEFRSAVVLFDLEGHSYEEIAGMLGVKLGTVRSRIHRGRRALRLALAHRAPRRAPAAPAPVAIAC